MSLTVISFGFRKLSFSLCNLCFSLTDSSLRVDLCLVYTDIALFKLCLKNRDLLLCTSQSRFGLLHL